MLDNISPKTFSHNSLLFAFSPFLRVASAIISIKFNDASYVAVIIGRMIYELMMITDDCVNAECGLFTRLLFAYM